MHDGLTTIETEIDCPYFETDWITDHPDWPPDRRITALPAVDDEER